MGLFSKATKAATRKLVEGRDLPAPVAEALAQRGIATGPAPSPVFLRGGTGYCVEVVGESNYLDNIRHLTGRRGGEVFLQGTIVREPSNRFDPGAVRVDVAGLHVGYLPRSDAPRYHRLLDTLQHRGQYAVVQARVWSSGSGQDDIGSVSLDVADPAVALTANVLADAPEIRRWPEGRRLQIAGEADHMGVIADILAHAYEPGLMAVWLELLTVPNGQKIAVHCDSRPVGELSGASTKKFSPHLARLSDMGRRLFALGEIKGNSLSAEITVSLVSPEELTESQIAEIFGPMDPPR